GETLFGGLGFDFKWNMGWMHDTLDFFSADPLFRGHKLGNLTFNIVYAFSEKFVLPLSHDEVVHGKGSLYGKMPGDREQKLANLRLLISYMFSFPGKKLLFMGSERSQESEWDYNSSVVSEAGEPEKSCMMELIANLNNIYENYGLGKTDCLQNAFQWIDFNDRNNTVISFMRKTKQLSKTMVFIFNFNIKLMENYRIGVPKKGMFKLIFNSDSKKFGGLEYGGMGDAVSEETPFHGYLWS
ncbi:glycogen branching enzyme, partial [mine drainage metagenome]